MTQREIVLGALRRGEPVNAELMRHHGIVHLPGTIHALRASGYPIEQVWRSANGRRWSEYRLIHDQPGP